MDKPNNDDVSKQLDDEYRKNLHLIRPYIIKLVDVNSINRCRIWLEKMDKLELSSNNEKRIRNDYLTELRRQMQTGKLELPFSKEPPNGPLEDLASHVNLIVYESDSWSDCSEGTKTATEVDPDFSCEDEVPELNTDIDLDPSQENIVEELKLKNTLLRNSLEKCIQEMRQVKENEHVKLRQELSRKDRQWQKRMIELESNIKTSYEKMITNLSEEKFADQEKDIIELQRTLEEENQQKMNKALEEKKTELDNKLINLELKMRNETEKLIAKIKEDTNNAWQEKLNNLQKSLVDQYEQKINEIIYNNDKVVRMKDEEVSRLHAVIEEQCEKLQDAVQNSSTAQTNNEKELTKKITFLQNYVLKLEKLFKKYESKYTQKMTCIKRDLAMKENAMQIQIMAQQAQLVTQCRTENQKEIEMVIDKLENKYRELLDDQMKHLHNCKYLSQEDVT